jgi:intein/homing endonuclease
MQLNEEQMQAVNHLDGPCVVIANPGAGKCIVGESLVFGCKGSPIMSQIKEEDIDSIFSFSKETLNCSDLIEKEAYFINSGKHKTITVSTDYGFEIEGTENHPIAVLNNDGYLCWKQLCKINVGDICPIWTNKKINISNEFSKEYYLMGILLGDGCLGCGKYFTFHSEINSISDEFCKIIKELYGYNVGKGKDKRRKNLYRFYLTRNFIVNDLVNRFGDIRHGACEKYLTKEMLSGTDFEIRSLISGLFDTDGYVGKHEIEIILCTKKLIDQLHVLLLRFGVFSYKTIKYVNRKPYYRISIYGDDFRRFVKNIGFRHEEKKRKSLSNLFNIKTNPNKFIYNTKNLIRNIRGKINGKSFWKGHTGLLSSNEDSIRLTRYCTGTRHVTDLSVNRISKILKTYNIENESMQQLQFLSDNFTFSKVTKVNKKEELVNVYDYSVSDTHNFISNGFISHNTACITSRVVNLINNGVSPANILCLTFTNKASEEMRSRIASKTNNSDKIWISTFHKLCVAILRKYGKNIGLDQNFSILIESDQTDLIKKIFRMHEKETNDKLSSYLGNKIIILEKILLLCLSLYRI